MRQRRIKSLGFGGQHYKCSRTAEDDAKCVLDFGKYKGMPLLDVAEKYPKYVVWAVEVAEYLLCSSTLYEKCRKVVNAEWELKNRPKIQRATNEQVRDTMAGLHASGIPVYRYDYDPKTGKIGPVERVMPPRPHSTYKLIPTNKYGTSTLDLSYASYRNRPRHSPCLPHDRREQCNSNSEVAYI